jgi:hypothetical protein
VVRGGGHGGTRVVGGACVAWDECFSFSLLLVDAVPVNSDQTNFDQTGARSREHKEFEGHWRAQGRLGRRPAPHTRVRRLRFRVRERWGCVWCVFSEVGRRPMFRSGICVFSWGLQMWVHVDAFADLFSDTFFQNLMF